MSAISRTDKDLVNMKPKELELHYGELINTLGANSLGDRFNRNLHYMRREYYKSLNQSLRAYPWLQNKNQGVLLLGAHMATGIVIGNTSAHLVSTFVLEPKVQKTHEKYLVKACTHLVGTLGGWAMRPIASRGIWKTQRSLKHGNLKISNQRSFILLIKNTRRMSS